MPNEEMRKTARIAAAWKKWTELSGVLCDRRMPVAVKGKAYRTMVRPVLIYGSETWTLKSREEVRLERIEMGISGVISLNPWGCLLYTSPSPRDRQKSRMPSSA